MKILTENKQPKAFIDTNVILDALTGRDYLFKDALNLIRQIVYGNVDAYICNKQITDIYYISKKYYKNEEQRRKMVKTIIETFNVLPFLKGDVLACINTEMKDFEYAILDEVAKVNVIPYFITNNVNDFKNSKSTVVTPKQFLDLFQLK